MTQDEQTILRLTRENESLKFQLKEANDFKLRVGTHCTKAGVPHGFEDGNSYDDYSTGERVAILADSYLRVKGELEALIATKQQKEGA